MLGGASFGDNVKAKFGAGDDLQIYHSGTESIIAENGTGDLKISGNNLWLQTVSGETYFRAVNNSYAKLYYDNAEKLATTSTGVDVTGTVNGLEINTTATSNLGLGTGAVDAITTGDYNVGVGDSALTSVTEGVRNTGVGTYALISNVTGSYNTALSMQSLNSNTTGNNNTATGYQALKNNTTGNNNTANGYQALYTNTTGANNTATGLQALYANTTGVNNTANSYQALYYNTTGANNTASGYQALKNNTTGAQNTASGMYALYANTTGNYNTASGMYALNANTTGANNTANGYQALYSNTKSGITANGFQSLYSNTTGVEGVAVGYKSLVSNTTGNSNTANGYQALYNNTTGTHNVATGAYSLYTNTVGYYNTAIGTKSLRYVTTGANNTALGTFAGDNITTGSSNIIIGANVDAPSATASNQLNIGNTIYGDTSTGNVGIGTATPSVRLTLAGAGGDLSSTTVTRTNTKGIKVYDTGVANTGNGIWFDSGSLLAGIASTRILTTNWGTDLRFYTHPTATSGQDNTYERMRIDSNGTVLVGKTTSAFSDAGTALYQNGELNLVHANNAPLYLRRLSGTGTLAQFWQGSSVVGSIGVTGSSTSYNTSSDYRLKENVVPMTGSIDRLKALKPSSFNFISEPLKIVDGFLAHEAGEVVPECATGTKDAMMDEEYEVTPAVMDGETVVTEAVMGTRSVPDYQGIDQSKLVPLLVASLQEAIARIEVLENA
jgi:hypothetical protein